MKSFLRYSLFAILYSTFSFLLPSPIFATKCSNPTDFSYPAAVLHRSENHANDCSFPQNGSSRDMNTIINGELGVQNVPLLAALHGDKSKLRVNGRGQINLTLEDLSTFGIGGDILSVAENRPGLQPYRKVIDASGNYDIGLHVRDAIYDGIVTYADFVTWACDHNLCVGDHLNPSVFSSTSQLSTLEEQLEYQIYVAKEIINCNTINDYYNSHYCSNIYPLGNTDSFRVAQDVKSWFDNQRPLDVWLKLTDEQKFLTFGIQIFSGASAFAVIVPQQQNCTTPDCFLSLITSPDRPGYLKFVIPNASTIQRGTALENNRISPLKDQTDSFGQSFPPANTQPLLTTLLEEIKSRNGGTLTCSQTATPPSENLGAVSKPTKNTPTLSIFGNFFSSSSQDEAVQDKRYCIFVFTPPEVAGADKALGSSPNSLARKLEPLNTTKDFDAQIDAPQSLNSSGQGATEMSHGDCLEYVTLPDNSRQCAKFEENYVSYGGGSPQINQPGRYALKNKSIFFSTGVALNSLSHIKDLSTCLVPWLARAAEARGFDLAGILRIGIFSNSSCPNPTKNVASGNYMCSGTMGIPLTSASGSCKLCNLDSFEYGAAAIPPEMITVIESAAQENNVPASIILAIMAAEGGFQRPCYNPPENGKWTDAMVCADEIPFCDTCNVAPSTGARGPFQIIERWFNPKEYGQACNFTDAARAVARNAASERDGNPLWTDTSCGPWIYNSGSNQTSCSDWTLGDVVTAARAFRGVCDEKYIQTVVNYWQQLTCGQ